MVACLAQSSSLGKPCTPSPSQAHCQAFHQASYCHQASLHPQISFLLLSRVFTPRVANRRIFPPHHLYLHHRANLPHNFLRLLPSFRRLRLSPLPEQLVYSGHSLIPATTSCRSQIIVLQPCLCILSLVEKSAVCFFELLI